MITDLQFQVDIPKTVKYYEAEYPMEMSIMRLTGVYHAEISEGSINPYTGDFDIEYFGNISEHCVAVALCADILTDIFMSKDNPAKRQIVGKALVHDAGKRFEIMRKKAVMAGGIIDAYSPSAHDTIKSVLKEADIDDNVIKYILKPGQETGHNSLVNFVSIHDGQLFLITESLPDIIVHLADDMTYSPIVRAGETAQAIFVTIEERMRLADFPNRYPFLYRKGFGFDKQGKVVMVEDVKQAPQELIHVRTYADWQTWVNDEICRHLISRLSRQSQLEDPALYVKALVNANLGSRNEKIDYKKSEF